jgi:hypothetical protein
MTEILHFAEMVGMALAALLVFVAIVILIVLRKRSKTGSPAALAFDAHELDVLNGSTIPTSQGATHRGGRDTPLPNTVSRLLGIRLKEARAMRDREQARARRSGLADVLLTIGDYVVGAVLATTFAEHELPSFLVGGLGLVVLVSSTAKQRFHPEIEKIKAARKAARLRKLVRETENIVAAAENAPSGKTRVEIIQRLSQELAEIELEEQEVFRPHALQREIPAQRN